MENIATLKQDIKHLMVENLMLQITAGEIGDEQPLFGPGSLGLDSVDALQLVVALDKKYGLKIPDPEAARQILQSVTTMAKAVAAHLASRPPARSRRVSTHFSQRGTAWHSRYRVTRSVGPIRGNPGLASGVAPIEHYGAFVRTSCCCAGPKVQRC